MHESLIEEVWKELNSLITSLEKKTQPRPWPVFRACRLVCLLA